MDLGPEFITALIRSFGDYTIRNMNHFTTSKTKYSPEFNHCRDQNKPAKSGFSYHLGIKGFT